MSLLAKFEAVEIQPESRISEMDKANCEDLQQQWETFFTYANQYIQFIETHSINTDSYSNKGEIQQMKTSIKNQIDTLIKEVCNYFANRYKVTIDNYEIRKKYENNTDIHYGMVLEEIFEQLGGYSFQEKALAEIKEKCKSAVGGRKYVEIKGKKLSITNFIYWSGYRDKEYKLSYNETNVHSIFVALSHFASGHIQMLYTLAEFYRKLSSYDYQSAKFDKHQAHHEKVLSVKIFKNHKVEIEFESNDHAKAFACDYLGVTLS